jgi:ubiquinone/menaquinone biosynthesis C-methylase UbiE
MSNAVRGAEGLKELYDDYSGSRRGFGQRLCNILLTHLCMRTWGGAAVLDVGCGDGLIAEEFAAHGALVVAMDANLGWVQTVARRSESGRREASLRFLQANGQCLPFVGEAFDLVLLSDVLEHVMHPDAILAEAARVLKPGGIAYIATTNRWSVATFFADPHYHVPGVNLMPRPLAAWYVTRLCRVSHEYGVGWYFSKPKLRRLIANAGLAGTELHGLYEEKIRSGSFAKARGRAWLTRVLRRPLVREVAIAFSRTSFFNILVQPGWEFLAFRTVSTKS